jgi:anti-anti-sigma factor
MSLTIQTESTKPQVTKIALGGRLDTNTTSQLDNVLSGVLGSDTRNVVYDLADLEYISSAGLRAIFRTQKELAKKSGGIAVVNVQPQVQKVFDIVQALPVESIFTSWDEVDDYLDKMQKKVLEGDG